MTFSIITAVALSIACICNSVAIILLVVNSSNNK